MGLPVGTSDRESAYQCRRHKRPRFGVWVGTLEKEMATHSGILGEFHGQRNLTGYNPWGCRESDITEEALHKGTYHQKFRFHQSLYVFYQSRYLPPKITFPSVTS